MIRCLRGASVIALGCALLAGAAGAQTVTGQLPPSASTPSGQQLAVQPKTDVVGGPNACVVGTVTNGVTCKSPVLDSNTAPVTTPASLTADVTAAAGRTFVAICAGIGVVSLNPSGGGTRTYPVFVGLNIFPIAVTKVNSSGSTGGPCTYENWP